jgi:hypothetical protein
MSYPSGLGLCCDLSVLNNCKIVHKLGLFCKKQKSLQLSIVLTFASTYEGDYRSRAYC